MAKKIEGYIRLQIPAGQANPAPPVGPALGQAGLSIPDFCKSFNATTQNMEPGMPIPVRITVYQDKTYSFETKSPPASYYIKKAARIEKGSETPGIEIIASISKNSITFSTASRCATSSALLGPTYSACNRKLARCFKFRPVIMLSRVVIPRNRATF